MNITLLTVKMMLNISARWLESEAFIAQLLAAGPIGQGIHDELEGRHESLAKLSHERNVAHERVRALIDLCTRLDGTHDCKGRGLYNLLGGLIDASDDEDEVARYRELQALLFPQGLRVLRLPYIEEGGAAVELDRAVGPEIRKQLGAVTVGSQTLEQVFEAWMQAGHELGEAVRQRAELQASLRRQGSVAETIDLRAGRRDWQQAVRGLLWAIDARPELHALREPVMAALEAGVETALRRRSAGGGGEDELDEPGEVEDQGEAADGEEVVEAIEPIEPIEDDSPEQGQPVVLD